MPQPKDPCIFCDGTGCFYLQTGERDPETGYAYERAYVCDKCGGTGLANPQEQESEVAA